MSLLEVIVVCFLIFCLIRGYTKGFLFGLIDMAAWVLAVIGGIIFSPFLSSLLEKTSIYFDTKNSVSNFINLKNLTEQSSIGEKTSAIEGLNLPYNFTKTLLENNNIDMYKTLGVSTVQDYIVTLIMSVLVHIVAFLIITIVIFIVIFIIKLMITPILNLPIIGSVDKFAGAIVGIFKGVIILWILMLIVPVIIGKANYTQIYLTIVNSKFLSFLYSNNFILNLFLK